MVRQLIAVLLVALTALAACSDEDDKVGGRCERCHPQEDSVWVVTDDYNGWDPPLCDEKGLTCNNGTCFPASGECYYTW
jgi:hypothetical protein